MKVIKALYFIVFSPVILFGMIHRGTGFAFAFGKGIALELLKGI